MYNGGAGVAAAAILGDPMLRPPEPRGPHCAGPRTALRGRTDG